jgi:hypothetical protein
MTITHGGQRSRVEIVVSLASAYSQWLLAEEGRGTKKHREILLFHKCESDLGSGRNGQ